MGAAWLVGSALFLLTRGVSLKEILEMTSAKYLRLSKAILETDLRRYQGGRRRHSSQDGPERQRETEVHEEDAPRRDYRWLIDILVPITGVAATGAFNGDYDCDGDQGQGLAGLNNDASKDWNSIANAVQATPSSSRTAAYASGSKK